MAKYYKQFYHPFSEIYRFVDQTFSDLSSSTTLEAKDGDFTNATKFAVFVYERYSCFGRNRLSLTVCLLGDESSCKVYMVSSGGSQSIFKLYKIEALGEQAFLNLAIKKLEEKFQQAF